MFERLLVAVDGTEASRRTMRASVDVARQLRADITGFVAEPFESRDRAAQAHAEAVLHDLHCLCDEAGVGFHGASTQARHIDEAILDAAHAHRCDLIVMTTDDQGRFERWLHGSWTQRTVRRSPVPVLVLPT
jgi:nucleotide-binding universal stress UspA family protein